MGKDRLVAFTDAVLAIVITILVMDLHLPLQPTPAALWALRENFFAYGVSFFWIGAMWINLHNQWHRAKRITTRVAWHSILMLFFFSLLPYVTRFAGDNLQSMFALVLYWAVSLLATINFMAQGYALGYYNRNDPDFLASARVLNHWMWVDLGVNIAGLGLALLCLRAAKKETGMPAHMGKLARLRVSCAIFRCMPGGDPGNFVPVRPLVSLAGECTPDSRPWQGSGIWDFRPVCANCPASAGPPGCYTIHDPKRDCNRSSGKCHNSPYFVGFWAPGRGFCRKTTLFHVSQLGSSRMYAKASFSRDCSTACRATSASSGPAGFRFMCR